MKLVKAFTLLRDSMAVRLHLLALFVRFQVRAVIGRVL